ncbi:MAG: aspartyl protease family protein [Verrucomicrobia bacterium]|nr:aspartyl protease family protein [Verrucomicrobiota bacterium]
MLVILVFCVGAGFLSWREWQSAEARRQAEETHRKQLEATWRSPVVLAKAKDCLAKGESYLGLNILDEVLSVVELPDLLETKVCLLSAAERHHEAYELVSRLIESQPNKALLHNMAAGLALKLDRFADAIRLYETAVKLEPKRSDYRVSLARACLKDRQVEKGINVFVQLLAEDPNSIDWLCAYSSSLFGIGEHEKAVALHRRAVEDFPNSPDHRFYLASILDRVGTKSDNKIMLQEAAAQYRQALVLRPMSNSVAAARYYAIMGKHVPPALEEMTTDVVALESEGEHDYLRATINGVAGRFMLDTGASSICIYRSAASKFRVRTTSHEKVETANGVVEMDYGYAEIELGKFKIDSAKVSLMPDTDRHEKDGLFGKRVLNKLCWQIQNNQNQTRELLLKGYNAYVSGGDN